MQAPDMERDVPAKPFDTKASYTAPFFTRYLRANKRIKGMPKGGAPFGCAVTRFRRSLVGSSLCPSAEMNSLGTEPNATPRAAARVHTQRWRNGSTMAPTLAAAVSSAAVST